MSQFLIYNIGGLQMKQLIRAVLLLLVISLSVMPALAGKIKGSETPNLIPDEIAYRRLFLILTVDKSPASAASVQAYCDFVLKLTQPEKEELLKLVDSFNAIEKEAGEVTT